MTTLAVGDIVEATITQVITDAAVLLSYGTMTGTLQLPEISWLRARSTAQFSAGDTVRVRVIAVDHARFSASIRQLHPEQDPWLEARTLVVGQLVECVVRVVVEYGVWFRVGAGLDGLWLHPERNVALVEGERVTLVVHAIDDERQTIVVRPARV